MKKALWVKWSEDWKTQLTVIPRIEGLELDGAEKRLKMAEQACQLFNAVPMGNA